MSDVVISAVNSPSVSVTTSGTSSNVITSGSTVGVSVTAGVATTLLSLPTATTTSLGTVIVGSGLSVTSGGSLAANVTSVAGRTGAVTLAAGDISGMNAYQPAGDYATLTGGKLAASTLPTATTTAAGAIIVGSGLTITNGVVSASGGGGAVASVAGRTGVVTLTKSDVGLGSVDNTSDADKPVSTAQASADTAVQDYAIQRANHTGTQAISTVSGLQAALDSKQASGSYATLDGGGKVPASQLPSYVDDVIEAANLAALPTTGETGKIYVTLDTNKTYRWSGSAYVEISASPGSTDAVPEGSVNLYHTNARASAAAPVQSVAGRTGNVTIAAADVLGLGSLATQSSVSYGSLTGVPSTFAPSAHKSSHATGGSDALSPSDIGAAAVSHTHSALSGDITGLAAVATSGSAADLTGTLSASRLPSTTVTAGSYGSASSVGTFTVDATGRLTAAGSTAIAISAGAVSGLAAVATSGSYSDLSNKPTIPSAYTLPQASDTVLGGVKVGSGLAISGSGVLSASGGSGAEQMLFVHDIASTLNEYADNTLVYGAVASDPYTAYNSTTGEFTVPTGKGGVYAVQNCAVIDGGSALASACNFSIFGSICGQVILNITTWAVGDGTIRMNSFGLVNLTAGETVNFKAYLTASSGDGWLPNNAIATFNYVMLYKL